MPLEVQIFGYGIANDLFIFLCTCAGAFTWWLTAMFWNVHQIKNASIKRGKQLDLVIIKQEALTETLGTDGISLGKMFRKEYDTNVTMKIAEHGVET